MSFVFTLFALTALPSPAFAWNAHGHRVIASAAYKILDKSTRDAVDAILLHHPEAAKWAADYAKYHMEGKVSRGEYAFMQAGVWPDQIRRKGNPYDHPTWHYIDYPLIGPDFAFKEPDNGEENILMGIEKSRATLADTAAKPQDRAASLAWLIHLVGDLHQPLHCATWVDADHPKGDKGGNETYLIPAEGKKPINLHSFMDTILGGSNNPYDASKKAIELVEGYDAPGMPSDTGTPKGAPTNVRPKPVGPEDPKKWSIESRETALKVIYQQLPPKQLPPDNEGAQLFEYHWKFKVRCSETAYTATYNASLRLRDMIHEINPTP